MAMERSCDTVGTATAHDFGVQSQREATNNTRTYEERLHLPRLTCVNSHQLCCGQSGSCLQQLQSRPAGGEQNNIQANHGVTATLREAGTKPTYTSSQLQLFLRVQLYARLLPSTREWRRFCHGQKITAFKNKENKQRNSAHADRK